MRTHQYCKGVSALYMMLYLQHAGGITLTLSKKSHIEEFEGIKELFNAMVSPSSKLEKWSVVSFPLPADESTLNCTVFYLDQCTSWNKCRQTCLKTGATSSRWFHDGCCECVGTHCLNYGVNESRCRACPESETDDEEGEDEGKNKL